MTQLKRCCVVAVLFGPLQCCRDVKHCRVLACVCVLRPPKINAPNACKASSHQPPGGSFDSFDVYECMQRHIHAHIRNHMPGGEDSTPACDDFRGAGAELPRGVSPAYQPLATMRASMRICSRVHENSSDSTGRLDNCHRRSSGWILIRSDGSTAAHMYSKCNMRYRIPTRIRPL